MTFTSRRQSKQIKIRCTPIFQLFNSSTNAFVSLYNLRFRYIWIRQNHFRVECLKNHSLLVSIEVASSVGRFKCMFVQTFVDSHRWCHGKPRKPNSTKHKQKRKIIFLILLLLLLVLLFATVNTIFAVRIFPY